MSGPPPSTRGRIGTVINGKWRIDAKIGSGGMSTVFAATHRNNGSRAALKILHSDLAEEDGVRDRFLREGYVANQVRHPGIVEVIDDDISEQGDVYLVVELLEGKTLEAMRIAEKGKLPTDRVLAWGIEALEALAAAHAAKIVHRDLKPDNLFLTTAGRLKILDFGLARLLEGMPAAEKTRAGVMIGTPEYMAPEQATAQRDQIDAQSDVWGMGATMYTLITGKYVHTAGSMREQLIAAATRKAEPIKKVAPWLSDPIAAVIDRSLLFEKHERWPDAKSMLSALVAAAGRAGRRASKPDDDDLVTSAINTNAARTSQPVATDDAVATLLTPMTRDMLDRMEGEYSSDDDTLIHRSSKPSSQPPPERTAEMPPISVRSAGGALGPPPPPPRPRVMSRPDVAPEPRPQMHSQPLAHYQTPAPFIAPPEMAQPPGPREPAPPPEAPRGGVSWSTVAIVLVLSILLAVGGTFAGMRFLKKR
jgi:serine/threonine-protein kinase